MDKTQLGGTYFIAVGLYRQCLLWLQYTYIRTYVHTYIYIYVIYLFIYVFIYLFIYFLSLCIDWFMYLFICLCICVHRVILFIGVFFTFEAFQLHNSISCSEHVCVMCRYNYLHVWYVCVSNLCQRVYLQCSIRLRTKYVWDTRSGVLQSLGMKGC